MSYCLTDESPLFRHFAYTGGEHISAKGRLQIFINRDIRKMVESSAALGLPIEGETGAAGKGSEGEEGTNR
jgi:hypothetical protein